jgi:sugar lactone lactonase YvrE
MNKIILIAAMLSFAITSCKTEKKSASEKNTTTSSVEKKETMFPELVKLTGIAQNPEGIVFDKNDNTFLLSSLNAEPIIKVNFDGTFKPFTSGEQFPLSSAGLEVDHKRNRLLVAGFNGMELMDNDPNTKGVSFLRIYNLKTGVAEKDINLSSLVPDAPAYMANDVTYDKEGNVYVTDWYARVVYKVDVEGNPSVFWKNETGINSGANGIDFHPDNYLLVSLVSVNEKNGLYENYGLVKVPANDSESDNVITFENEGYKGFDGMVLKSNGNIVGVTNNGTAPGGNTLIELSSNDNWKSAKVVNSKSIPASTTATITTSNKNYVINQDFTKPMKDDWTIEQVKF